jgi:hypothetical protein
MQNKVARAAFAFLIVGTCVSGFAQQNPLNTVPRYDDADEYLPKAEARNSDKVRLFLKQQPNEETLTAISDRNVSIKVIANISPDATKGVVLFVGGSSVLSIGTDDKLDRSFNYTSRSRDYWWKLGFATFLVDAPSDRLDKDGINTAFRTSPEFAADMRAVFSTIEKKFDKPLFAVGHSRGAVAVAALAAMPDIPVASYILVSPVYRKSPGSELVSSVKYAKPVVIVENTKDGCDESAASGIADLPKRISAPSVKMIWIDGGKSPIGGYCGPFGFHSFFGFEQETVATIAKELN